MLLSLWQKTHLHLPSSQAFSDPHSSLLSLPSQIHNWAADLTDGMTPSLEFVSVGECYTVVNGKQEALDVAAVSLGCVCVFIQI